LADRLIAANRSSDVVFFVAIGVTLPPSKRIAVKSEINGRTSEWLASKPKGDFWIAIPDLFLTGKFDTKGTIQ